MRIHDKRGWNWSFRDRSRYFKKPHVTTPESDYRQRSELPPASQTQFSPLIWQRVLGDWRRLQRCSQSSINLLQTTLFSSQHKKSTENGKEGYYLFYFVLRGIREVYSGVVGEVWYGEIPTSCGAVDCQILVFTHIHTYKHPYKHIHTYKNTHMDSLLHLSSKVRV